MSERDGATRIADERRRQCEAEGYDAAHDDEHDGRELAIAAACYTASAGAETIYKRSDFAAGLSFIDPWPWSEGSDARPHDGNVLKEATEAEAIRLLEKAGALCAAEIDRLLRAKRKKKSA